MLSRFASSTFALLLACASALTACAVDGPTDSGSTTVAGALSGGCRTICPKCPAKQICPMQACYIDCDGPKECLIMAKCAAGYRWSTAQCKCVPDHNGGKPGACSSDADCRLVSNYCGGCFCDALSKNQQDPTCISTVKCFTDPCMNHSVACVAGVCAVQ